MGKDSHLTFLAELKSTSQTKKISLDNEYKIVLITDNPGVLDLGKLPPDVMLEVSIRVMP